MKNPKRLPPLPPNPFCLFWFWWFSLFELMFSLANKQIPGGFWAGDEKLDSSIKEKTHLFLG